MPTPLVDTLDLALTRRSGGVLPGEHAAPGVGTGTELAQLRPYQPGDDVRLLDPAATARTRIPHIRLQVPERILTTWIVLDVSASMGFGTAARLKSDVAEGVVLALGRIATRRGGRVAAITTGRPQRFLPPRNGRHAGIALARMLSEGVELDGAGAAPLVPALHRVGRLARHPGLVVVVSDFRGEEPFRGPLGQLSARHRVVAVEVRDPRELDLPAAGQLALVDPETGNLMEVDTSSPGIRRRFADAAREERAAVAGELRRARAEHIVLSTDSDWLRDLTRSLR
ncbi:MAG TPA: DUF58 domain-containing protein [Thermoleophilaceae bacterium]|nr:DUF58 domain-containing protein [Thermoleophilaceae bacterium]